MAGMLGLFWSRFATPDCRCRQIVPVRGIGVARVFAALPAGPLFEVGHNLSAEEVEGAASLVGGQHRSQRNWPGDRGDNIASRKRRAALAAGGLLPSLHILHGAPRRLRAVREMKLFGRA
jgi:hypothetical protein